MNLVQKMKNRAAQMLAAMALTVSSVGAQAAGLPGVNNPTSSGATGTGIQATIQNHFADGGILAGLVVATVGFLIVAVYGVKVFAGVQDGRKTWTDFGAVVVVGGVLLVLMIWLLTEAAGVLA